MINMKIKNAYGALLIMPCTEGGFAVFCPVMRPDESLAHNGVPVFAGDLKGCVRFVQLSMDRAAQDMSAGKKP